ncbi:MAG: hypothetical protein V3U55_02945, partial [Mycobacterium sp.]
MVIVAMVIIAMVIIAMVIIAMVMVITAMVIIAMVIIAMVMVIIAMVIIAMVMVIVAMVIIAGSTDRAFSQRALEADQVHGYWHRTGLTAGSRKCSRRDDKLVVNPKRRGSCIAAYENSREYDRRRSPPVSMHAPTSDH